MEKFIVIFSRLDNRARATFNGSVYDSGILHGNPVYPEAGHSFEIQPLPNSYLAYPIQLIIQGFNSRYTIPGREHEPNPFHIAYKIVRRTYDSGGNVLTEDILFEINDSRPSANADSLVFTHNYVVRKNSTTGQITIEY